MMPIMIDTKEYQTNEISIPLFVEKNWLMTKQLEEWIIKFLTSRRENYQNGERKDTFFLLFKNK